MTIDHCPLGTPFKDEELFHFTVTRLSADAAVRSLDFVGRFNVGGAACEHLTVRTPAGDRVRILSSKDGNGDNGESKSLLKVTYTQCDKGNPDFRDVHDSVLKNVDVNLSSVVINVHQDAIMDLADKVVKFVKELSSSAKNLMAIAEEAAEPPTPAAARRGSEAPDQDVDLRRRREAMFGAVVGFAYILVLLLF